jgi:hypothetical protein
MPSLTLADALKYFFSPFLLYFYLAIYDMNYASHLQNIFGFFGTIAFLVAGSVIYFFYRYIVYEFLILWFYDVSRRLTYRRFFALNYQISTGRLWLPSSTIRAKRLFQIVVLNNYDRFTSDSMKTKVAGVYMLHQAGFLAIPFLVFGILDRHVLLCLFYALCVCVLIATATVLDCALEDEELCILRSMPAEIDTAAQLMCIPRRS